jgi:cytidine deaminase
MRVTFDDPLIQAALKVRENAYAPLTGFKVGAALQAEDGTVITGANIESPSGIVHACAEQTALWKAMSDGHRTFTKIAVVGDYKTPLPPCGYCRQTLIEFGPDIELLVATTSGAVDTMKIADLMPASYDINDRTDR